MSLETANDALRTSMLELLWAQWTDLGVSGTRGSGDTIIDPEALVMATLNVGRFDPRLFDEVLDWLTLNGDVLDVTRLRRLVRTGAPDQQRLARVVIDFMRKRGTGSKWAPLSNEWQASESSAVYSAQSLFWSARGDALPVFGEHDPFFASYGFTRPPLELRQMSDKPHLERPRLARLAARALVGIGVRAEVLAYLWTHDSAHGRLISARTDYSQRQVSEYLAGLAVAGFAERFEDGKSVQYRLVESLRWKPAAESRYVDWARAFAALGAIQRSLAEASTADSRYEASVIVRSALTTLRAALPIEGLAIPLPKPEAFPGESVLGHAEEIATATSGLLAGLARAR
jgi:DNA-binding transcriptional ArsR family regulator